MATPRQQRPRGNRRVVKRTKPWIPPFIRWSRPHDVTTYTVDFDLAPFNELYAIQGIPHIRKTQPASDLPTAAAIVAGALRVTYATAIDPTFTEFILRLPGSEVRGEFGAILAPSNQMLITCPPALPQHDWSVSSRAISDVTINNGTGGSVTYIADPGQWLSLPSGTPAGSVTSSPTTFVLSFGADISADTAISYIGTGISSWTSNGAVPQAGSHPG